MVTSYANDNNINNKMQFIYFAKITCTQSLKIYQ